MPIEESVKCFSPQNVLGVNSVATKSNSIEVNDDRFFKQKKNKTEKNRKCLHIVKTL